MAAFAVDSNGKRIKSDILVNGWIRIISLNWRLPIPADISRICFDFWLIKVFDEWDKKFIENDVGGYVQIDNKNEQIVRSKEQLESVKTVYGCHGVDKGSFEWQIKFKTYVGWICVGIMQDDQQVLKEYKPRSSCDREEY